MSGQTFHGGSERVSWSVVVVNRDGSTSTTLYGDREEEARQHYGRRAKFLHRGLTVRLERTVRAESWVQHTDPVESFTKPAVES